MHRFLFVVLLFRCLSAQGQIIPKEGVALNYRTISFRGNNFHNCNLEIAVGIFTDPDSFKQNTIITQSLKNGQAIIEVPAFGAAYTWRIKEDKSRALHHFRTLPCPYADTAKSRLRIVSGAGPSDQVIRAGQYPGYYVFVDKTMSLYDMNGKIVWFLPRSSLGNSNIAALRDLKLTPQHTLTFIAGDEIREIDCNGKILWHGPNSGEISHDTTEAYHHEFTRLANGSYMVLGTEQKQVVLPSYHPAGDSLPGNINLNKGKYYQSIPFGTLIEYDTAGKVLWAWHSCDYFLHSEMFSHYMPDGSLPMIDVHENAFWFDAKHSVVYIGFKNISRILKISYPGGKVLADYGSKNPAADANHCSADFCGQHSLQLSENGELLLFNNNCGAYANLPQAAIFREVNDTTLKKIWAYECTWDDIEPACIAAFLQRNKMMAGAFSPDKMMAVSMQQSAGGNFIELPGDEYFVSTSGVLGKMFIVNRQKKILWCAVAEQKIFPDAPWTTSDSYRAAIISRADLEAFLGK